MINIAIFASGSGSNTENIIKYFKNHNEICVKTIISNNPNAYVLERAKKLGIQQRIFTKKELNSCNKLLEYLEINQIKYIILAGFLLKIPSELIKEYNKCIINIHPSLLPKYGGKGMYGDNVHKAVVAAKEIESGISIHFVNEEYDEGAIIFQAKTSINPFSDSHEDVSEKIHQLEHKYFPKIIEQTILKQYS